MATTEQESDFEFTKDTAYLPLKGELKCVFCENLGDNWSIYHGAALYVEDIALWMEIQR